MGRSLVCAAVLSLFIFASCAEAARQHVNFSQGKYYERNPQGSDKRISVETKDETKEETPIDTTNKTDLAPVDTIHDRYPHGYPGQERYNTNEEDSDPEAFYAGYKNVKYSADTDSTASSETIPDRYPRGYPGFENPVYTAETDPEAKFRKGKYVGFSTQVDPNDDKTEIPNRYPEGYYGEAAREAETQGEADVYISRKSGNYVSYSTDADNTKTEEKDQGTDRYRYGYYAGLNPDVSTETQPNTYKKNQVNYQQYSNSQPRFGYEGIQGDFSTQLQGAEIPFELTGGACPTQYWVINPQKWPKFFNINSKVIDAFGDKASKVYGEITLLDALTDTRAEPYSRLVNTACTALLNSYSRAQYKLKHTVVIEAFNSALDSRDAAEKQALVFDQANVSVFSAGIGGSCT